MTAERGTAGLLYVQEHDDVVRVHVEAQLVSVLHVVVAHSRPSVFGAFKV